MNPDQTNYTKEKSIMAFSIAKVAGTLLMAVIGVSAHAALVKSYDFNGGLSDTLGNGVDLVASGGTVAGGKYSFAANQGLRLGSALPSATDYGIEMRLRVTDSVNGYNKLIDFQDLASDLGLYIRNGTIYFYTTGLSAGSLAVGTDYTIGFARAGGLISAYLDGGLLWSAADGASQAVPGVNVLNFFEDDFNTGQRESFAGVVDFIRIHDGVSTFGTSPATVPEPGTLPLAAIAVLAALALHRRGKAGARS